MIVRSNNASSVRPVGRNLLTDGLIVLGIPAVITALAIATKSFWGDEVLSIRYAAADFPTTFTLLARDYHPPLYFLLMKAWIFCLGPGEIAVRSLQGVIGAGFIAAALGLFRREFPERRFHPFFVLLTVSPELWLYLPMARYYLFAATLVVLSFIAFRNWLAGRSAYASAALGLSWLALLYTDYPASVVIGLQLLIVGIKVPKKLPAISAVAAAAGVLFLPWAVITFNQITRLRTVGTIADFNGSSGALVIKFAYGLFAFLSGETIYPFEPAGVVLLTLITGAVLAASVRSRIWADTRFREYAGFVAGGLLFTAVLTTYLSTHTSFIYTPARTLFALVFVYLAAAALYDKTGYASIRLIIVGSLAAVSIYGCFNWTMNRHFLMPVYATPWKAVMTDLRGKEGIVYAEESLCFEYYRDLDGGKYPALQNPFVIPGMESTQPPLRSASSGDDTWLILMGRESTEPAISTDVLARVESTGMLQWEKKYLVIDESYRSFKSRLLHRDPYDAKVTVRRYAMRPNPF